MIELQPTPRGFLRGEFNDANGESCSIQESSSIDELLWIGTNDANPVVMVPGKSWQPVPLPDGTVCTTRMHLTRENAAELIPLLQRFVDTGTLSEPTQPLGPLEGK